MQKILVVSFEFLVPKQDMQLLGNSLPGFSGKGRFGHVITLL